MKNRIKMRTYFSINPLGRQIKIGLLLICVASGLFSACNSDDITNYRTNQQDMLGEHLRGDAQYSEFVKLLDTTNVMGLLDAYGTYTCFAPTNDAMSRFYARSGRSSLKDFTPDTLLKIAYDHLIKTAVVRSADFGVGRLSELTMSDRFITVSFPNGEAFINEKSKILGNEIAVHNGVIHNISEVINPTEAGVVEAIAGKNKRYSIFYEALKATGLSEQLLKDRDRSYDPSKWLDQAVSKELGYWYYYEVPLTRKFGYTVLMESDSTMNANEIHTLEELKVYAKKIYDAVYPEDANIDDIKNRKNSLNRFIAYHLINKQLSFSKLIDDYDTGHMLKDRDMYEYIETMCPNTLLEVKKDRAKNMTVINYIQSTNKYVQISAHYRDQDAKNGVFHELTGMLLYSKDFADEISSKRLRFDAASFFPELANNNMRGLGCTKPNLRFALPPGYIDRITASEQTIVGYLTPYTSYGDYEGDEIYLNAKSGKLYDFSITTPPVPKGTYEVRFCYLTNGSRGVAQFYFDDIPTGVPLNLNNGADNAEIGYETIGSVISDPNGYENDKMMRNRGYMKGPDCYKPMDNAWYKGVNGESARYISVILRKILGTYRFDSDGTHKLTVKGLSSGEFMFDFMEFVPTNVLDSEDIY